MSRTKTRGSGTMSNNQERINQVSEQLTTAMEQAKGAVAEAATKVSDFFQGNPFETEVGKKIELATDADRLQNENWGLNMEICDYINFTNDGGRNALRSIKRRLETQMGKHNGIVMYTLTILETCVKNCDQRFKALVCQKEFINELVKMIGSKYDAPQAVQERVLELIQSWADAFRGNPALVGVCEVYDELKAKGVEFPATDFDKMAPIITPKRTVFADPAPTLSTAPVTQNYPETVQTTLQTFPVPVAGDTGSFISAQRITTVPLPGQTPGSDATGAPQDPLTKLRADVDVVTVNITVLRDLLGDLTPGEELPEELKLINDLHEALQNMQQRIVDLINSEFSDDVTYELITVNQEINNCFEKYTRYMAKKNGEKPLETPEGEDAKQLREQLESFGVYEGVGTSKDTDPNRKSVEKNALQDEPQLESLRTVAMEKPMLSDDQAKEVAEWLGQEPAPKELEKKQKPDDGL